MTAPATRISAGLPVLEEAHAPAWVRRGSAATKQDYATALGFEALLVEQLTKSMAGGGGIDGESSEGEGSSSHEGAAGTFSSGMSQLSTLLPQALASGVAGAGGLGLATQLTRELQGVQHAANISHSGGTPA